MYEDKNRKEHTKLEMTTSSDGTYTVKLKDPANDRYVEATYNFYIEVTVGQNGQLT